jgi:IMP dehydrogenase
VQTRNLLFGMDETTLTAADIMLPVPVSVSPRDAIFVAADLIRAHRLGALLVLDDGRVAGIVTPAQLLRQPLHQEVADVMTRDVGAVAYDLPLLQVYAELARQDAEMLPVVRGERVVGQLSLVGVLRALHQQIDPLTGLPWGTALRSWARSRLETGRELAILFIDLDNFRIINKALGHVVGDDILKAVVRRLEAHLDPATDLLCRYGGDEFVVGTTRREDDAQSLAQRLHEHVRVPFQIDGDAHVVTLSVGYAGGRRVDGRMPLHAAATYEDLVAMASNASTAAKERAGSAVQGSGWLSAAALAPVTDARFRLHEVTFETESGSRVATVRLALGARPGMGTASDHARGRGAAPLVVEAALRAITATIGDEHIFVLERLATVKVEPGRLVVVVLRLVGDPPRRLVGAAHAPDLPRAAASAVLDAVNRSMSRTLAQIVRRAAAP